MNSFKGKFMSSMAKLKQLPKILVASMMGNCLEQFDFALYIYLAPVLAPLFFPAEDKITSLILSLSVYAMGFITRPLGAVYFGRIGDSESRKKALSLSIFGMALSTAAMGLVPTYAQIGICAPFLIIALRLIQSFCVAGEYNGAAIFVLEQTPSHRQNLISGIYTSSGSIGSFFASLVLGVVLRYQADYESLWRFAFIIPLIFGFIGYYIRQSLPESLTSDQMMKEPSSLKQTFQKYPYELFFAFGIASFSGCVYYFMFSFPSVFIPLASSYTLKDISTIISIVSLAELVNLWVMGHLADRIGSEKMMMLSAFGIFLLGAIYYMGIISNNYIYISVSLILFTFFVASFLAPSHVVTMKLFPMNKRYTAVSLAFNLGNGLLGATSSLIAITLYKITENPLMPLFYLFFCAALFLLSFNLYFMKKNKFNID